LGLVWKGILRRNLLADLCDVELNFLDLLYEVHWVGYACSNFPMRGCSVCARKRDKYIEEYMELTISLRGMFGLHTFGNPYSLGGRGFVWEVLMLIWFYWECWFFSLGSWCSERLVESFNMLCPKVLHLFLIVSDMFMTTVVLPLSAESMMSVSQFNS